MGSSLSWQTDTQLHDSVQRQLEWDPQVESHDVAVIASEGVITLTGFVHSYAAKLAAERSVKRVQGVRGVANEIQVAPLTQRTDTDIARGAVHALRAHASVPMGVKVTARNGYLTLEGRVSWMFEKEAAADAVAHLDGVKGVSNQIAVKPSVAVAEVKADIDAAIHRCADVDAEHVRVSVDGSVVTLSGEVSSWHERQEAERVAWSAPGISHVENLIVVASSAATGGNPWSLR